VIPRVGNSARLVDVEMPDPRPGQALVRVLRVELRRTDVEIKVADREALG
jgi:NADPH:quinone reductase-like Zn-dependent oxidoreductase